MSHPTNLVTFDLCIRATRLIDIVRYVFGFGYRMVWCPHIWQLWYGMVRTARLVGYSAGCQIAYRIALTLEAAGVPVQLALLDGCLPALNDGSTSDGTAAGVDEMVAVLRSGADLQLASAAPGGASNPAVHVLLRLGAMLGDDGCTLADALLRLTDEAPADLGGTFGGATVYLKTRGKALVSSIKDTRIVDGGHFDFMLDHAADVARIVGGFFAEHE